MDGLRFRVLGPLEVRAAEGPVAVPVGKPQALLATLLLRANQVVSADELIDRLWVHDPPPGARQTLQVYVLRVRRALGRPDPIQTRRGGYSVQATPDTLDLLRFRQLLDSAKHASDPTTESAELAAALALWRRPILAEILSPALHRAEVAPLNELWAQTTERHIDVDLGLGRHTALIDPLTELVAEFPLRERFWAQLMTALYRSGRTAEALETYRTVATTLAEELGIDPGPELRRLHEAVLASDPLLAPRRTTAPAWVAHCQLPLDVPDFVGRADQVDRVAALATGPGVPVVALTGAPGVGKTALAIRVAHRLRPRFPDGQWYVRLDGTGDRARDPADVLAELLRTAGVDPATVPDDLEQRAAALRSALADRMVLLLLDDARDTAQVRPLLPGTAGSAVLVTSRHDLGGLALHGGHRVPLDVLDPAEAAALVGGLVGAGRVAAEPDAAAELARLCGGLPLALRIAAANVAGRPDRPLAGYVELLRDGDRLARLAVPGDPQTAVRAAFDLSHTGLDPAPRRLFGLLGLVPAAILTTDAAAALLDATPEEAEQLLERLATANLVQRHAPDEYLFHDLIRLYAAELAAADPSGPAAWRRLCDHYLGAAVAAGSVAYPQPVHLPRPPLAGPAFERKADALGWLDANRAALVAIATRAAETGPPRVAWQLADTLRDYLLQGRYLAELRVASEAGLRAARAAGDRVAAAMMGFGLGSTYRILGDYAAARTHSEAALEAFTETGERGGRVAAMVGLGMVYAETGELARGAELLEEAVVLARQQGLTNLAGNALIGLFAAHHSNGAIGAALRCVTEAAEIFRGEADHGRLTAALINRAVTLRLVDRHEQAATDVTEALELARRHGLRHYEASALVVLALVALDLGDPERALTHAVEGQELSRATGMTEYDNATASALGWVYYVLGRYEEAVEQHARCLEIGTESGFLLSRLQGHVGLASAYWRLGDLALALEHGRLAAEGAAEEDFAPTECEAAQLLAVVCAELGDDGEAKRYAERAERIRRETGYRPAHYMPAPS